jgi:hypothetical protein
MIHIHKTLLVILYDCFSQWKLVFFALKFIIAQSTSSVAGLARAELSLFVGKNGVCREEVNGCEQSFRLRAIALFYLPIFLCFGHCTHMKSFPDFG